MKRYNLSAHVERGVFDGWRGVVILGGLTPEPGMSYRELTSQSEWFGTEAEAEGWTRRLIAQLEDTMKGSGMVPEDGKPWGPPPKAAQERDVEP